MLHWPCNRGLSATSLIGREPNSPRLLNPGGYKERPKGGRGWFIAPEDTKSARLSVQAPLPDAGTTILAFPRRQR